MRDLVGVIIGYRRHQYEFTAQSVGCRRWIANTLELFEMVGFIGETAGIEKDYLARMWPDDTESRIEGGEHYD